MIKPDPTEKQLQTACENYLKNRDILYKHDTNTPRGKYRRGTNVYTKGWPDLTIYLPNATTIFVELKTPTGKMSVEQIQIMGRLESLSFDYHIITNIKDFVEVIEKIY